MTRRHSVLGDRGPCVIRERERERERGRERERACRGATLPSSAWRTRSPLGSRGAGRSSRSPTPSSSIRTRGSNEPSPGDAGKKKAASAAMAGSNSPGIEKLQQELSQTKIELYRSRLDCCMRFAYVRWCGPSDQQSGLSRRSNDFGALRCARWTGIAIYGA